MVHERCTRLRSGARDCGVVHEYEWCTMVQERCTRLRSGTQVRVVHDGAREVHEITWQACPEWDKVSSELACRTSFTVHLDSTFLGVYLDSTFLGVHLDSTFLGVHLDSTFLGVHLDSTSLGVHLDSTFLSSGLDLAKEELQSSWWTRARRYRNSSGRLGMGNPGAVEKFLVPLQDLQEKDPLK